MLNRPVRRVAWCSLALVLLNGCGGGGGESGEPRPSPTSSVDLPSPTRTAEKPSPTRTVEKPSPTRTAEEPSPTRTAEEPSPTRTPAPTQSAEPSPSRTQETNDTAEPAEPTGPSEGSQTGQQGAAQPTEPTAQASTAGDQGDQGDEVSPWVWWLLAVILLAALAAVAAAVIRARRRRRWLAELGGAEDELGWFARVLLPELRRSTSLEQVVGGWTVGAPRVADAEDRLTVLEDSAPSDADRERARTLRDAARQARQRLDALTLDTPHETWALDLDEVTADLEVALGPASTPAADPDAER